MLFGELFSIVPSESAVVSWASCGLSEGITVFVSEFLESWDRSPSLSNCGPVSVDVDNVPEFSGAEASWAEWS